MWELLLSVKTFTANRPIVIGPRCVLKTKHRDTIPFLSEGSLVVPTWLCVEKTPFMTLRMVFSLPPFLQPVSWASRPTSPSSCPTLCWASDAAPTSWTTFSLASPGSLERRWGNTRGLCYLDTSQLSCRKSHRLYGLTEYLREIFVCVSESCRQREGSRCAEQPKI